MVGKRTAWFVLASLVLHGAAMGGLTLGTAMPDLGVEFEMPAPMEFGVEDGEALPVVGAAAEEEGAPEQPERQGDDGAADAAEQGNAAGAGGDDGEAQASTQTPRSADDSDESNEKAEPGQQEGRDAKEAGEAEQREAIRRQGPVVGADDVRTAMQKGSRIELRIDMRAIRQSPFEDETRGLLRRIPEWQTLLASAPVDPVRDLDALVIATPDFSITRMLVAGQMRAGASSLQDVVDGVAARSGRPVNWRRELGIPVTDWPSRDGTQRVLARLSSTQFVIGRVEDVPKLLATLAGGSGRLRFGATENANGSRDTLSNDSDGADPDASSRASDPRKRRTTSDTWLALAPREVLRAHASDARSFLRGAPSVVPQQLTVSVVLTRQGADEGSRPRGGPPKPSGAIEDEPTGAPAAALSGPSEGPGADNTGAQLKLFARYANAKEAREAEQFVRQMQAQQQSNIMVAMSGMGGALMRMQVEQQSNQVVVTAPLHGSELRALFALIASAL